VAQIAGSIALFNVAIIFSPPTGGFSRQTAANLVDQ
jgi:hypothetical protein